MIRWTLVTIALAGGMSVLAAQATVSPNLGTLKDITSDGALVEKVHGCHRDCRCYYDKNRRPYRCHRHVGQCKFQECPPRKAKGL